VPRLIAFERGSVIFSKFAELHETRY
jgi:hypothetical protein